MEAKKKNFNKPVDFCKFKETKRNETDLFLFCQLGDPVILDRYFSGFYGFQFQHSANEQLCADLAFTPFGTCLGGYFTFVCLTLSFQRRAAVFAPLVYHAFHLFNLPLFKCVYLAVTRASLPGSLGGMEGQPPANKSVDGDFPTNSVLLHPFVPHFSSDAKPLFSEFRLRPLLPKKRRAVLSSHF